MEAAARGLFRQQLRRGRTGPLCAHECRQGTAVTAMRRTSCGRAWRSAVQPQSLCPRRGGAERKQSWPPLRFVQAGAALALHRGQSRLARRAAAGRLIAALVVPPPWRWPQAPAAAETGCVRSTLSCRRRRPTPRRRRAYSRRCGSWRGACGGLRASRLLCSFLTP